jgi:uncharacterized SAM-binding protein YcdF (DUF218 family)
MNLKARLAQFIHDFLDVGKSPCIADCIFVMAGKQNRKAFGIKMWHIGYAAQLILSIGRFEWRKYKDLGLESDGGLESMVTQIPPPKRHFLIRLNSREAICTPVKPGYFGTYSEARNIAKYLRSMPARSLLVVSSPIHLRRVALAFRRSFRKSGVHLTFVGVPETASFDSPAARTTVWVEFGKYLLYRIGLARYWLG